MTPAKLQQLSRMVADESQGIADLLDDHCVWKKTTKAAGQVQVLANSVLDDCGSPVFASLVGAVMQQKGPKFTIAELVTLRQAASAIEDGNTQAAVFLRDTAGEKPSDKIKVQDTTKIADISDELLDRLEAQLIAERASIEVSAEEVKK
jgi:hypothetical protein